ncbi:nicotinate (nicotinamide) nucleotide adenylyltransferase [Thermocrinis sp.]
MKVFFGGSFDPVHLGHLLVARDVLEELGVEEIIFLPAYQAPLKEPHKASPEDRLHMLRLAVKEFEGFSVSSMEMDRNGVSYTVDTAQKLFEELKEKPTFLVGADSALSLHLWKEPAKLVSLARFVVIDRASKAKEVKAYLKEKFPELKEDTDYIILSVRRIDISSTEIRRRVKEGKSIRWLVPACVEEYIIKRGLYR